MPHVLSRFLRWPADARLAIAVAALAAIAAIYLITIDHLSNWEWGKRESFKVGLQFILVTILSGAVLAFFSARKEAAARRERRAASIQELDEALGKAYRMMKTSRRKLRSRLDLPRTVSIKIPKQDFRECMEEILAAQILTEEVEDRVELRRDLIDPVTVERLKTSLHYAARYLHDVFEDFEQGRVQLAQDRYVLTPEATPNLWDFLIESTVEKEIEALYRDFKDQKKSPSGFEALQALDREVQRMARDRAPRLRTRRAHSESLSKRRQRIAFHSFGLTSYELKRLADQELIL